MTTSNSAPKSAYVWIWLPTETEPVVAGQLTAEGNDYFFNYGRSYLDRKNAISIYPEELPLKSGALENLNGLSMPGCLRDASPDAWGRRVIINKKLGHKKNEIDPAQLDELTYMLESGSDRIGALDFQTSATEYIPRQAINASLEELMTAAERVEAGVPLNSELDRAIHHGSSIGGARPKALIDDAQHKFIAKFSSSSDVYNVVKGEFITMRLAQLAGLNVAPVTIKQTSGKDVLLIERFDRVHSKKGWQRKGMVSALTLLALDEMMARYASYEDFAEIIRHKFKDAAKTLHELFSRLTFNILCGNTDDHARNHAAFWNGKEFELTPAYDICPQARSGREANQAMCIYQSERASQISVCLKSAGSFLLSANEAKEIVEKQIQVIKEKWKNVCDEAKLSEAEQNFLWGRQILNPYALEPFSFKKNKPHN